jgi:hypothetical protein
VGKRTRREPEAERISKAVEQWARGKAVIYRTVSGLPQQRSIEFGGDDVAEFLQAAARLRVDVIYVNESPVGPDSEGLEAHEGEIMELEVAFERAGFFHVFRYQPEWAIDALDSIPYEDEDEEPDQDRLTEERAREWTKRLSSEKEELLKGFLLNVKESGRAVELKPHMVEDALILYLHEAHAFPATNSWKIRVHHSNLERALSGLVDKALAHRRAEEQKAVEAVVGQCAEWAMKNGLRKLSLGDLDVFLGEEKIVLSKEGARGLWQKANFALKTSRVPR